MTTIYLVRHGQYSSPTPVIPYRMPGFHLSPEGREQASKLAQSLKDKGVSTIFTSPMERTKETAEILADTLGLKVETDDRLLEVRSSLQGMTKAAIEAIQPWDWSFYESAWYREQSGETLGEICARIQAVIEEKKMEYTDKTVVLVTHGDLVMLGAALYMGLPQAPDSLKTLPYVSMAGGYRIDFEEEGEAKVYPIVAS